MNMTYNSIFTNNNNHKLHKKHMSTCNRRIKSIFFVQTFFLITARLLASLG